ncbi:MAG: hypothetical protein ABIH23_09735, partial [bacterium]
NYGGCEVRGVMVEVISVWVWWHVRVRMGIGGSALQTRNRRIYVRGKGLLGSIEMQKTKNPGCGMKRCET